MSTIITQSGMNPKAILERFLATCAANAAIDAGPPASDEALDRATAEWASARNDLVDLVVDHSMDRGPAPDLADPADTYARHSAVIGALQVVVEGGRKSPRLTILDYTRVNILA